MKKLISLFLEIHQKRAPSSKFNISKDLDFEALSIAQECQLTCQNYKKHSHYKFALMFNRILDSRLTSLLDSADLLNPQVYLSLTSAILNWCPWQARKQVLCLKIKNSLLRLLPIARQKQQLQRLCRQYREHLQVELESQLQNQHKQTYLTYAKRNTIIFAAPPQSDRAQAILVKDPRPALDKIIAGQNSYIIHSSKSLSFALEKYKVVSQLQESLNTPVKSAPEQLKDFKQKFLAKRSILEKNRDNLSILFLKGVATVFSLGLAYAFGIWNVKGKQTAANLQQALYSRQ